MFWKRKSPGDEPGRKGLRVVPCHEQNCGAMNYIAGAALLCADKFCSVLLCWRCDALTCSALLCDAVLCCRYSNLSISAWMFASF